MVGSDAHPGIIPYVFTRLFNTIQQKVAQGMDVNAYVVQVAYYEIYKGNMRWRCGHDTSDMRDEGWENMMMT